MSANESRPGMGGPVVSSNPSIVPLDEIHRAFVTGWDEGYAKARRDASVDLACEWLHAQACRYAGIARQTATERHGPQWGETIAQAAEVGR